MFEGANGDVWWDLSNIDGSGPGTPGEPFGDGNVKVVPVGKGAGTGSCNAI